MADDGMLVNFTIGATSLKPKPTLKGGTWRDRLKVKKNFNGVRRTTQKVALSGSNTIPTKLRPTNTNSTSGEDGERSNKRRKTSEGAAHPLKSSGEVVSSLFTSNPKASSLQESANAQEEANAGVAPSNAPLPADDNPFSGLGLSRNLSAHLAQALSLNAPTAIQKCAIPRLLQADSDAFVQAETGSGKTLAYLLPILQRLMLATVANSDVKQNGPSSSTISGPTGITRSSGLFALILVPTRELTHQIEVVLTRLLSRTPRMVAGSVTGGATKNHEKARIRKGLNVLVATPGRLVDHLQHTESLDLRRVAWLVLDEGDRLMELGFEQDIKRIMEALNGNDQSAGRKRLKKVEEDSKAIDGLPLKRITVLCSATLNSSVQKLGEMSLKDAVRIHAGGQESDPYPDSNIVDTTDSKSPPDKVGDGDAKTQIANKQEVANAAQITVPAQLKQSYLIVPSKQRLVSLVALLRHTFARRGSVMRAIVFLSCADSVDFHFSIFGYGASTKEQDDVKNSSIKGSEDSLNPQSTQSSNKQKSKSRSTKSDDTSLLPTTSASPTLSPHIRIFRLHGSLAPASRNSTIKAFTACQQPCLLLATDVASRGLDLPNIDLVIEYDPAFSAEEHVHRVGRTARAGREGRAVCFLTPGPEEGYVRLLESFASRNHVSASASTPKKNEEPTPKSSVKGETSDTILRKGFTLPTSISSSASPLDLPIPTGLASSNPEDHHPPPSLTSKYDTRATDYQLGLERWILSSPRIHDLARKAYVSHVRAYATHTVAERAMFDVKSLQLGHLAKAFGLRDRPGGWGRKSLGGGGGVGKGGQQRQHQQRQRDRGERLQGAASSTLETGGAVNGAAATTATAAEEAEAARKMRESVRKMAKMNQGHDVGEFNIG